MIQYLNGLIGRAYTPGSGDSIAQVDFEWIAGAVLVILMVYCVFRLVGSLFK